MTDTKVNRRAGRLIDTKVNRSAGQAVPFTTDIYQRLYGPFLNIFRRWRVRVSHQVKKSRGRWGTFASDQKSVLPN